MKEIKGMGLNKLCAIGKIHFYGHRENKFREKKRTVLAQDIATELQRLEIALGSIEEELYEGERNAVWEEFHERARLAAFDGYRASDAVSIASHGMLSAFSSCGDPYISEMGVEISRMTAGLLRLLSNEQIKIGELLPRPVILACGNIPAKELMTSNSAMILGIFLFGVSPVSELAICAHSLGVPLIIGNEEDIQDIPCGEMCIIDSEKGTLISSPAEDTVEHYAVRLGGIALGRDKKPKGNRLICHLSSFDDNVSPQAPVLLQIREEKSAEELCLFFSSMLKEGELKIILPKEESEQRKIISSAIRASENGKITLILPSATDISSLRAVKYRLKSELETEARNISVGAVIDCGAAAALIDKMCGECELFAVDSDKLIASLMFPEKANVNNPNLLEIGYKAFLRTAEELICTASDKGIELCFFGMTASRDEICEKLISMGAKEIAIPFPYL